MILYIVRHAWAGHHGDPDWPDDDQRPLSSGGKKRFAAMAQILAGLGVLPTVIATSPLVRCVQTAERLVEAVSDRDGEPPALVEFDALRPSSDLDALVAWTREQAEEHDEVAWVGHAPDVGRLAGILIGGSAAICFAKGGVAAIQFDGKPAPGDGELRWLVTAKMLGC